MVSPANLLFLYDAFRPVNVSVMTPWNFKKHATARLFLLTGCNNYGVGQAASFAALGRVGNSVHVFRS